MATPASELEAQVEQLVKNLRQIGYFRRGTVNTFLRKCGKKDCVCSKPGHPGHGPQTTLTLKLGNRTFSRNLPTRPAVAVVEDQVRNHDLFMEWCKKWVALNEKLSDLKLEEALSGQEAQKKTVEKNGGSGLCGDQTGDGKIHRTRFSGQGGKRKLRFGGSGDGCERYYASMRRFEN
jgi:hypothetical protein